MCNFEHMFEMRTAWVGLHAGKADNGDTVSVWCDEGLDDLAYRITVDELESVWVEEERHLLPDIDSIPPGPFLAVLLEYVDRSRLNGFDLVRLLCSRERMVSHTQAEAMADAVEVSHAAPGDASSDVERLKEAFGYAADEVRAGLVLTRRAAQYRLSFASDLMMRLPRVWHMLGEGLIDLARARVVSNGTAHLDPSEAHDRGG